MERRKFVKSSGLGVLGLGIGASARPNSKILDGSGKIEIELFGHGPVFSFAASELIRYLDLANNQSSLNIKLGLFSHFSIPRPSGVLDETLDDAIDIKVVHGDGYIAGINSRSVLIAAYRFLYQLGFRWVRPGHLGEVLPTLLPGDINVALAEVAASRHRNICIEGAVSLSNVTEIIDWLPKVGFNSFFMQFREGYIFFDRWYSHEDNPEKQTNSRFDRETAREYTRLAEAEIKKRGLMYHAVGHGWHLEAFNVPGIGWKGVGPLPGDFLQNVATVKGQRWVPWDIPMLAALCYSDPGVQQKMVSCIANYANEHKNIDYLHVWLDDYMNNKCECSRCTTKRPSDWYFQILNKLDKELTNLGNPIKIVFLAYCDLLFLPLTEKIENEGRFVFMYANNRNDYSLPLVSSVPASIPGYKQNSNDFEMLKKPNYNVELIKQWKQFFKGDSFLYEYYLVGYREEMKHSATIEKDIPLFKGYGFNGISSCQTLRSFFPSGLSTSLLGHALWNGSLVYEDFVENYFLEVFGKDGPACKKYLGQVDGLANKVKGAITSDLGAALEAAKQLKEVIDGFIPLIEQNQQTDNPVIRLSWQLIDVYSAIHLYYCAHVAEKGKKNSTGEQFYWHNAIKYAREVEDKYQPWLEPVKYVNQFF